MIMVKWIALKHFCCSIMSAPLQLKLLNWHWAQDKRPGFQCTVAWRMCTMRFKFRPNLQSNLFCSATKTSKGISESALNVILEQHGLAGWISNITLFLLRSGINICIPKFPRTKGRSGNKFHTRDLYEAIVWQIYATAARTISRLCLCFMSMQVTWFYSIICAPQDGMRLMYQKQCRTTDYTVWRSCCRDM